MFLFVFFEGLSSSDFIGVGLLFVPSLSVDMGGIFIRLVICSVYEFS